MVYLHPPETSKMNIINIVNSVKASVRSSMITCYSYYTLDDPNDYRNNLISPPSL